MRMALDALAAAIDAQPAAPIDPRPVESYSIDSRTLQPGAVFFAIPGETQDGHAHVAAAFAKGAAAAVVSRCVEDCLGPQLVVDDSMVALQRLATKARREWGRTVIGITGSAGKTTTKDAVAAVLATRRKVGKTIGNFNNHLGVPLSILHLPEDADLAVLEIGMNHAGEIERLSRIARPDHAVVTNVGTAHIENFESIEGVVLAKRELVEALPPAGTAILNADDPLVVAMAAIHPGRTLFYGTSEKAAVRARNVNMGADGSRFEVDGVQFECPLAGRGGLLSALAALATARALGYEWNGLRQAIAELHPSKMRTEKIERNGLTIWNDCYNSNPEAAKMMLELLAATPGRRHIAVLGEMLELGHWSRDLHAGVGSYAAQCGISVLVGIRGAARHTVDAAVEAGMPQSAALFFNEPREAGQYLKEIAREGDALLFKGSRGTRVELALEEFLK